MNIIKLSYKPSKPVENYEQIAEAASELKRFIIEGNFEGVNKKAYCLHHSQVVDDSFNFFVVHPDYLLGNPAMFESRVIVNPEIIEYLPMTKPPFEEAEKEGMSRISYDKIPEKIETVRVMEGCMSFPHRAPKKIERWSMVKVRYQNEKMVSVEETCHQIKAQIFQHECQHAMGKNIYFEGPG